MKRAIIASFTAALLAAGCTKEDHAIRVKNDFTAPFTEMGVGEVFFSNIDVGTTTEYKPIVTGDFRVGGKTSSNYVLTGSGKINGTGKHRWTLTVTNTGDLTLEENK
jgi:hypothetical protein